MLSIQYLNKRLKKNHIEKILENYNIKYTTLKKEIDSKINIMMKTITQDISAFLTNMEDVAAEKERIKSHEINQNEIETLRDQVKDKIHEQTKLRREIEMLRIENNRLKSLSNSSANRVSSQKKRIAFTSKEKTYTQPLNTISNYQSATVRSSIKKPKDVKSLCLKTERREKKENLDSRLFKSPQASQMRKTQQKMNEYNLDDSSNKKKGDIKKSDKKRTHKSLLSYTTNDTTTEPNKKNPIYGSTKNLISKNKKIIDVTIKRNNNILGKNTFTKKGEKTLNKTQNNFNKNKDITKSTGKSRFFTNKEKPKEDEEFSSEKENNTENITVFDENNESNKSKTTEDNEEEQTYIDDEIKEMDDFEEDILSLMEQIKDFKQENQEKSNLT
jgi:hypothetical protein